METDKFNTQVRLIREAAGTRVVKGRAATGSSVRDEPDFFALLI